MVTPGFLGGVWYKTLCCEIHGTWEGVKPGTEQGLGEELWKVSGGVWVMEALGRWARRGGAATSLIQRSSSAIDNLSTDISLHYFYPEGGSFY